MTKTSKILLIVAIVAFGLGFTDVLWGVGKPIGAIFLGLFLISKVLEKESARFDEEQVVRFNEATKGQRPSTKGASKEQNVGLTTASAH